MLTWPRNESDVRAEVAYRNSKAEAVRDRRNASAAAQWRGPCPICHAGITTAKEHRFSVNVDRGLFQCFRCGRRGNQLDLWSQLSGLSLKPATVDLCHRLGIEPIRLNNPQPRPRP